MAETVATLSVDITANTRPFDQGLGRVESELMGAKGRFGGIGSEIGSGLMQGLGIGIGFGVAGVVAQLASIGPAVLGMGMAWEDAFTGVLKTVDGTSAELAALEQQLLALSVSDSPVAGLENAAIQLATIAEMAGQLGVAREDIVAFTETIAMLDMTTNLAGEEGAAMLAQFANITKMDMSNVDRLGATIVALGNAGASTEQQIVEFAHRLAGAGDQAGMTEAEILALGSAMASAGLNAEAGGTAMTTVLNKLATAAAKGGTALETLAKVSGTTAADFANTWNDEPTKALTMFLAGLDELDQATQLDILEELEMDGIRVSDTLRRLSNNVELVEDSLATANGAWDENSALLEEAEKRAATTSAQWNQLKNKVSAVGIALGGEFLPYANQAIDALGLLTEAGAELLGIDLGFDVTGDAPDLAAEVNRLIGPELPPIDMTQSVNVTIEPGELPWDDWVANWSDVMSWETYRGHFAEAARAAGLSEVQATSQGISFGVQMDAEIGGGAESTLSLERLNAAMYETAQAAEAIQPTKVEELTTKLDELFARQGLATDFGTAFSMIGTAFDSWVQIVDSFEGFTDVITDVEKLTEAVKQLLDISTPDIEFGGAPVFTSNLVGDWMDQADQIWQEPVEMTIPVNANLEILGVEEVDDLFSGVMDGQVVELNISAGQVEDTVGWLDLLAADVEYLNGSEIMIGFNGQVFTDVESLNGYIATLPIDEAAELNFVVADTTTENIDAFGTQIYDQVLIADDSPLNFMVSDASTADVQALGSDITSATRNRETWVQVNSNQAEVAYAINSMVADRIMNIEIRINSGNTGGGGSNAVPEARAGGGPVIGGETYWVGEEGPELFTAPGNGQIIPNHDLLSMSSPSSGGSSGGGGGITINGPINVYGVQDAEGMYNQIVEIAQSRATPGFAMERG